jgi:hypothetical protein
MKSTWTIRLADDVADPTGEPVDKDIQWSGRITTQDGALIFYSWNGDLQAVYPAGSWLWARKTNPEEVEARSRPAPSIPQPHPRLREIIAQRRDTPIQQPPGRRKRG